MLRAVRAVARGRRYVTPSDFPRLSQEWWVEDLLTNGPTKHDPIQCRRRPFNQQTQTRMDHEASEASK